MRKFYVTVVVCLFVIASGYAQTYTWTGPSGGDWSNAANWSGGAGFPNAIDHNVIFNTDVQVNLDIPAIDVNTLSITGTSTVRLTGIGGGNVVIRANSTLTSTPGLKIDAGSRLEDSAVANTTFEFIFETDGKGVVNGTWYFTGFSQDDAAFFTLPETGAQTSLKINSGGSIVIAENGFLAPNELTGNDFLIFGAGSQLHFMGDGAIIPQAEYDAASTILITGFVNNSLTFDETQSIGNLIYDCPGQNTSNTSLGLLNINVEGNLQVLNTNNRELRLLSNGDIGISVVEVIIEGNLNIQGNSAVVVSKVDGIDKTMNLFVEGNLIANGNSFNLQTNNNNSINPTSLFIRGNLQHTAGTFTASSTAVNNTTSLFIVDLNGTIAQTVFSVNGSIDNPRNQVTLRISNPAGASLLSPLQVGRINFNTASPGILTTTSANVLTINNVSNQGIVANTPSDNGFVNGPVRRRTNTSVAMSFPAGKGSKLRPATVIPVTAAASDTTIFEAAYFNSGYPDQSTVSPVNGISDTEYWEVKRISGPSNASVQLAFISAINGAQSSDALIVARYNGSDWVSAKGSTGTSVIPGNSSGGTVRSEAQTAVSFFTIGYGVQAALPIHLLSFDVKSSGARGADLSWKVSDDSTPLEFEIMRSADGIHFGTIGSVAAVSSKTNYALSDNSILSGNNYYRLTMKDKDGSATYSNIIAIMNGTSTALITSLMPTIVTDRARITVSSPSKGNMQLVVTDIQGRIMQRQQTVIDKGSQEIWINASGLAGGIYQITGFVNGKKTKTFRFIKR